MKSLPKRFKYKVTVIEESKDVTTMRLDELIGSLRTFEMGLTQEEEGKNKELAFVAGTQMTTLSMLSKSF